MVLLCALFVSVAKLRRVNGWIDPAAIENPVRTTYRLPNPYLIYDTLVLLLIEETNTPI